MRDESRSGLAAVSRANGIGELISSRPSWGTTTDMASQSSTAAHRATPTREATPAPVGTDDVAGLLSALAALVMLAVGVVGLAARLELARGLGFTGFLMGGVGVGVWSLWSGLAASTRIALSLLSSIVILILGATAMVEAQVWHPLIALTVVCALTTPALLWRLVRPASRESWRSMSGWTRAWTVRCGGRLGLGAVALAAVLCAVGLALYPRRHVPLGGFLRSISPVWYAGVLVAVLAAAWATRTDRPSLLALVTVELGFILTITPAVAYGLPRSQSAAKHVGIADHILTVHTLGANSAIYNGWSGFFAAMAWLAAAAGLHSTLTLATWWPVLFFAARLAGLRYLVGTILQRPRDAWLAVLVAMLADSIGADYFSPQSVGFTIGLGILALAIDRGIGPVRYYAIAAAGIAVTVSHQLSPYVIFGVLVVLVVFRLCRPIWLPLLVMVPTVAWTLEHHNALNGFVSLRTIGSASNFAPPSTQNSVGPSLIVRLAEVSVVLGVFVIGVFALVRLIRGFRTARTWGLAVAPLVGFAAIAANAYGAEGLFRAILFAIPWLAILAVSSSASREKANNKRSLIGSVPALLVLTACFLVGAFLLDGSSVIRSGDLKIMQTVSATASANPGHQYLLQNLGPGDGPTNNLTNPPNELLLARDDTVALAEQPGTTDGLDPVRRVTNELLAVAKQQNDTAPVIYAYWSPASLRYAQEYRVQSATDFVDLRNAFTSSPYWRVVLHSTDGSMLFEYEPGSA